MPNKATKTPCNETAQLILSEARQLFARRGFDGVSINDVAAAAGVSKANIFHHFGSKQALYMEVLKYSLNEFGELTELLQPERAPLEERLYHFMLAHASHLRRHPESAHVLQRELLENRDEVTRQLADQTTITQFRRLFDLLQEAQQAGEIRADVDLAALVVMVIGVVSFQFQVRSLLRHQPEVGFADDPEQYSRLLAHILAHGIGPVNTDPIGSAGAFFSSGKAE